MLKRNFCGFFLLLIFFGGISGGCSFSRLRTLASRFNIIDKEPPEPFSSINQSIITEKEMSSWQVKTVHTDRVDRLENVYFLDADTGFASSYSKFTTTIYQTTDGGISWKKISSLEDFSVSDLFFITPEKGFLVGLKLKPSPYSMENGSFLKKTVDGGKHWETVYSKVNADLSRLIFNSEGRGVAVGRNAIPSVYDSEALILTTDDEGQNWTDTSKNFNQAAAKPNGRIEALLSNALFSKDRGLAVLTSNGKIYQTSDQGQTWSLISALENEFAQTGIYKFGELDDGRFWMSGGAISIEGKWAMTAIMNGTGEWDRYHLIEYYFTDLKFLAGEEMIACGSLIGPDNFGGNNELNRAVVLSSKDHGRSWQIVYKSDHSTVFTSINRLSERNFLITGDMKEDIFLERIEN